MRNLYAKLGTHRRSETVSRARFLGLLAPPRQQQVLSATPGDDVREGSRLGQERRVRAVEFGNRRRGG
jgi:hypothetical protein